MALPTVVRRYWREGLLAVVLALPWMSLLVFGGIWLWQGGHVLAWAAAALTLGLLAWPLRIVVRRRALAEARLRLGTTAHSSQGWNAAERLAWEKVLAIANATAPLSFTAREPLISLASQTVETVARQLHGDAVDPWARFTLPEALLLAERVARDLRREMLRHIPGIRRVRLDHLLLTQRAYERYGAAAGQIWRIGYGLWRGVRMVLNPLQAVVQEGRDLVLDQTSGILSISVRTHATRLIVLEVGRAAIDLYARRLTLSDEEMAAARSSDFRTTDATPVGPVRILLAGQVNAGKSSLLNAMAKETRGAIGPLPTTDGPVDHLLSVDGRPAVVLVDTRGFAGGMDIAKGLAGQLARADLVLWVAAATQAARAADRTGLDAIRATSRAQLERRPPPILLALTHVDQLRPAAEWAPPYNVNAPATAKARTIRAAMDAVARELELPVDTLVPVALPPGAGPYNIDALWTRIEVELGDAQLVQLDRLRFGSRDVSLTPGLSGRWP